MGPQYSGICSLAGAALLVLPALSGIGLASAQDTTTAVIPLDLRESDFGRELTLLFTVAEATEACGSSDIQLNGQPLSTRDQRSGRDTIYEDYGSEIVAAWELECVELDSKPIHQTLSVRIESVDDSQFDDVTFTVKFQQSSPLAILDIDGSVTDAAMLDRCSGKQGDDFWSAFHHIHPGDSSPEKEVEAAISEIQFLRVQHREIGERIKELEKFVLEASPERASCRGRLECMAKHLFDKVKHVATSVYFNVMDPESILNESQSQDSEPRKRPHWRPSFCPCSPPPPPPPPSPSTPPAVSSAPGEQLVPTATVSATPVRNTAAATSPATPPESIETGVPNPPSNEVQPATNPPTAAPISKHNGIFSIISTSHLVITALVLLLIFAATFTCCRACRLVANWHAEHARRRAERRRRRHEAIRGFFRRLIPGLPARPGQPVDDMEQQRPSPMGEMQQRSRAGSDASNTMEQDLAQFRAAVDMVGDMVAAGEDRTQRDAASRSAIARAAPTLPLRPATPPMASHAPLPLVTTYTPRPQPPRRSMEQRLSLGDFGYPADLPPAYESEDEGGPMLSAVADGFRGGYGASAYSPGSAGPTSGSADELGYRKP